MTQGKSGWAVAEEAVDKSSSGIFVKLENDGDKVVFFFIGEPYTVEMLWDGEGYIPFTKEHEAAGKKPSPKFKFNVYVPEERAIKIYECNVQTMKTVIAVKKKYGFETKTFEVQRKGKKGDTKTTYSVLPDNDLTAEHREIMGKLPLHDLTKDGDDEGDKKAGTTNNTGGGGFSNFKPGADGVIDAKTADGFMARLKVRPRAEIDKFLARFGIDKIKMVKASDAALADKFITFLEGKGPNPDAPPEAPPAPAANDPFA